MNCPAWSNKFLIIAVMVLAVLVSACTSSIPAPNATAVPSTLALKLKTPSIRGTISDVYSTAGRPHAILVEGKLESDTVYDKATVRLSDSTRVYLSQNQNYTLTSSIQLTIGLQIEVVFTGAVLERNPVSAEADEILILGSPR